MTNRDLRSRLRLLDSIGHLRAAPRDAFSQSQAGLDRTRYALALLNGATNKETRDIAWAACLDAASGWPADRSSSVTEAMSREEIVDQLDEQLCAEAWRLVDRRAESLAELAIKARFVQEFTQNSDADIESRIALSLCCDVLALVGKLSVADTKD